MDELGLPGLAAPNNPAIDSFNYATGVATSVKTRDLHKDYYNANSLKTELRRDIRKLDRWNGEMYGASNLDPLDIKGKQLIVGIPSGTVSSQQYRVMVDAYRYGRGRGIHVGYVIVK